MIGISFFNSYWFDHEMVALWNDRATLGRWLEVEVALARVQAAIGVIPQSAAERIAEVSQVDAFDLADLGRKIAVTQHPLVPVLGEVERMAGEEAGGWLHWGATTQNIFDTAQSLQLKQTVALVIDRLDAIDERLASQAQEHAGTLQAGRTHGQHALPITFGFKLIGWLAELRRHRARLEALSPDAFVARLGGAVGSYAALDGRGREVERALAAKLELAAPDVGGRADFDRQTAVITTLAACVAACERIAADLSFLQRTEIAEVVENHYPSRIGSSTMAQKRNPSESQRVIALGRLVRSRVPLALESMVRQDEGDAATTNVTDIMIPDFCVLAGSAVTALGSLLAGIHVDAERMRANLDLTGGQISAEAVMMKLGTAIGRSHAHHILHEATSTANSQRISFDEAIRRHPDIVARGTGLDLDAMLDPARYTGEISALVADLAPRSHEDAAVVLGSTDR